MPALPTFDGPALARRFGLGRTLIGSSAFVAPELAGRLLGADRATARRVTWLARMMAVRDAALGVGTVWALRRGEDARAWLLAGAASDAVDAIVVARAIRAGQLGGPLAAGLVVGAGAAAGTGFVLVTRPD